MVPAHTIILDRTSCNRSNFTTIAPPPPATPPPNPGPASSSTCKAFYDVIRSLLAEPFLCNNFLRSCDEGILCRLSVLGVRYDITLSVTRMPPGPGMLLEVMDSQGQVLGGGAGGVVEVPLPTPENSVLTLMQTYNSKTSSVGMQVSSRLFLVIFCLSYT